MANTVVLKRSAVPNKTPTISDLALGELALNTNDGNLFFKRDASGTQSILSVATLTGTQTFTNKTLTSPAISSPTITGNIIATGTLNSFGNLAGTAPFSNNATRSLNLIGDNAVMRVARTTTTGDPAVELLSLDPTTGSLLNWWDFFTNNDQFNIRRRTGGAADVLLRATATNVDFPLGSATLNGVAIPTISSTNTLTNKTLQSAVLTGSLTAGGGTGAAGQVLASTGAGGVQWVTRDVSTLNSLTDVIISSPSNDQVLKFNGAVWVNGDVDVATASAVFAANAESDLGLVTDLIIGLQEDLGLVTEVPATFIYNMGSLVVDGIVSLNNLDQSVKADYIAYSIIFGF